MKFRVVLCLVLGLFYVKCMQSKNVPRFHVGVACAHIEDW